MTLFAVGAFAGFLLLLLAVRPFITLTHELGHALVALWLTRGPVVAHVGGYDEARPQLRLRLGRLTLCLNLQFRSLLVGGGFCRYVPASLSWWQYSLILLAGPLVSFVVAAWACYAAFHYEWHGAAKVFLVWAVLQASLYLVFSLIPNPHPILLADGSRTYNDGWQLRRQWRLRRLDALWAGPLRAMQERRFAEAGAQFERLAVYLFPWPDAHRMAIGAYLEQHDYPKAAALVADFAQYHVRTALDYAYVGLLACRQQRYEEGVAALNQALALDADLVWALQNRGYTLDLLHRPAEAVADFSRALELAPEQGAYALAGRGLAYWRLGDEARALDDLHRSLEIDEHQPYVHRNWGIYYFERGDIATALGYFRTAQALDARTHLIDDYLAQAHRMASA